MRCSSDKLLSGLENVVWAVWRPDPAQQAGAGGCESMGPYVRGVCVFTPFALPIPLKELITVSPAGQCSCCLSKISACVCDADRLFAPLWAESPNVLTHTNTRLSPSAQGEDYNRISWDVLHFMYKCGFSIRFHTRAEIKTPFFFFFFCYVFIRAEGKIYYSKGSWLDFNHTVLWSHGY